MNSANRRGLGIFLLGLVLAIRIPYGTLPVIEILITMTVVVVGFYVFIGSDSPK